MLVVSLDGALVAPLAHYVEALHVQRPDLVAPRLPLVVRTQPGIVITSIPFQLPG